METRTYRVYSFEEASDELKEKILENYRYINVDDSFWYAEDEIYNEIAKDYGISINMNKVSFSLDRENYVAFDTFNHGRNSNWTCPITIENIKKFCKKAGVKYNPEGYISIGHNHYAGGIISNIIETDYEEEEKLQECLKNMLDEILTELKRQYVYATSDEEVTETLKCNEYMFTEEGKID